jgi:hypothetical protein
VSGKGASWEREVCRRLSLWWSKGESDSLLWRTAMSGGRATIQARSGIINTAQAGDIGAIHEDGLPLLKIVCVECKFWRDLDLLAGFIEGRGKLFRFWEKHRHDSERIKRQPLMIAKQNRTPALLMTTAEAADRLGFKENAVLCLDWGYDNEYLLAYRFDDVIPPLPKRKKKT